MCGTSKIEEKHKNMIYAYNSDILLKLNKKSKRENAQATHIQVQYYKNHVMSPKCTPVTQSILCLIFLMCIATMYNSTTVDKNLENNLQFMILTYM